VLTEASGQVPIEVPRDRAGTFEPRIVRKRQRAFDWCRPDGAVVVCQGADQGEISAHPAEIYGASVS